MSDLTKLRDEIDEIDKEIVRLFERRMDISRSVAEYKISTGKHVLDKGREHYKLKLLKSQTSNSFYAHGVEELFTQIMSMSRKLQYGLLAERGLIGVPDFEIVDELYKNNVTVAYQGIPGSYGEEAMRNYFPGDITAVNVNTFNDAMCTLRDKKVRYAVLPLENSTAGIVSDVYDLLVEFDNYIVDIYELRLDQNLLAVPGATLDDIRTVYSHPQGLMQSSKFLDEHDWERITMENTAVSARHVANMADKSRAAIGSVNAAKNYGLCVLQPKINHNDHNFTRFVIISRYKMCRRDAGKILVSFETPHESGSLYNMLSHFIYNDLNMTRIESRPIPGHKWEFRFYVEFEGAIDDPGVVNALGGIRDEAQNLKVLGNY